MNPYEVIKQATLMPKNLQEEFQNSSLDNQVPKDRREPLTDAYIDNRLRSDKPIVFLDFINDLRRLWEAAGKRGNIIRHSPLKEDSSFPLITYRLMRRTINEAFKDMKPRYRTTIRHPYRGGEYVELYGQIFDLLVEFCVYSQTAEEADELVVELEEFLQTYAGFFKRNGVQEITFEAQGEDEVVNSGRISIAKRRLQYTMRFEKIIVRYLNEIQQIAIQAEIFAKE